MPTTIHESITFDRVCDACDRRMRTLDNPGFCLECGEEQEGFEPDAVKGKCETCGASAVYGSDEILLRGLNHK